MNSKHNIALELVRSGPAHNQLLSPLTPYIALCGGDSPVTMHFPFEHHQLLLRLQRLRYELESGAATEAQTTQRQAELHEMGKIVGDLLGEIPALIAELNRLRSEGGRLIHLRLSLSASELSMVPFETALSPAGFPGSGSPLFLQSRTPISLTREIRRGRQLPLQWAQRPKILFAFASPPDLAPVPFDAHLKALRDAIDPWVKIKDDPMERLAAVKKLLTVLPNASLQELRDHCTQQHYTHVHILAHGAPFNDAGDRRFGIALCCQEDKSRWEVVDGESLGIALTTKSASGATQYNPTIVTLATCDSGNINSVITPGGSIAHELHTAGIPWVIASQFPLWMSASNIAVHELYRGLLEGEDPRWVLYTLRRKLRTDCPHTHDWASIVAYATVPADFDQQIEQFYDAQMRAKLEVQLNRLDDLFAVNRMGKEAPPPSDEDVNELDRVGARLRELLARWQPKPTSKDTSRFDAKASMRLGMSGAYEKRLGIAYWVVSQSRTGDHRYLDSYKASRDYYRQAIEADPSSIWVITQYLSMNAILGPDAQRECLTFGISPRDWWFIAIRLAKSETDALSGTDRAFALTNLVELTLLGCRYATKWNRAKALGEIKSHINDILQLAPLDRTPVIALLRQLWRYCDFWPHSDWDDLTKEAIIALQR